MTVSPGQERFTPIRLTSQFFVLPAQLLLLIHSRRDGRDSEEDRIRQAFINEDIFDVLFGQGSEYWVFGHQGSCGRHTE